MQDTLSAHGQFFEKQKSIFSENRNLSGIFFIFQNSIFLWGSASAANKKKGSSADNSGTNVVEMGYESVWLRMDSNVKISKQQQAKASNNKQQQATASNSKRQQATNRGNQIQS